MNSILPQGKKCSSWTVSFHWKFVSSANKGQDVWLSSISSKILYREFHSCKEIPSTTLAKLNDEYPNISVDWKEIYYFGHKSESISI